MKLSNYLVLMLALVFLGGMTGCGKGNSAGGEENKSSSSSNTVTTGTGGYVNCQMGWSPYPDSIDCITQMVTKTSEGRFVSAPNGKRFFYMGFDSSSGASFSWNTQFYGKCYKFLKKLGVCDEDNYGYEDIGSSFDFERKVINSTTVERTNGDDTSLSTNLVNLKSNLASLLNKAKSLTTSTGQIYNGTYRDYFFDQENSTRIRIKVRNSYGTDRNFKLYIIDLSYPLAANPVGYFDGATGKGYILAGESF